MSVEFGREYDYGQGLKASYAHIGQGEAKDEPFLCIHRDAFGHRRTYAIELDLAYTLADDETLMHKATLCAKVLHLDVNEKTLFKLCDILQNHLDELIKLPTAPVVDKAKELEQHVHYLGLKIKRDGILIAGS